MLSHQTFPRSGDHFGKIWWLRKKVPWSQKKSGGSAHTGNFFYFFWWLSTHWELFATFFSRTRELHAKSPDFFWDQGIFLEKIWCLVSQKVWWLSTQRGIPSGEINTSMKCILLDSAHVYLTGLHTYFLQIK